MPGYGWWDVPVAEVSELASVNAAREEWEEMRAQERYFIWSLSQFGDFSVLQCAALHVLNSKLTQESILRS